ncbi:MAG: response regulator [Anaerolineales bacterium]|jgi:CheY-like chemotaxis protein
MACILFIDDDPYTLDAYTKAVEIFGHQAILASSGQQALDLAAEKCPDLIMLDVRMPDMDGFELLAHLQEDDATSSIPVVMLSAGPELDAAEQAKTAGAVDYLNKPVRLNKLIDTIQRFASD